MTFFNKKEEVMQVELTIYGRYLLSIGKLMPHHYKFFDENVAYDSACYGSASTGNYITEEQNNIHYRIMEETPRPKTNPNVTGVSTNSNLLEQEETVVSTTVNLPNRKYIQTDDNINFLQQELGTNSYESNNSPALQIDLFEGEISSSTSHLISQNTQYLNIPQVDVELNYEYYFVKHSTPNVDQWGAEEAEEFTNMTDPTLPMRSETFSDDTYFKIIPKTPLVRVKEHNSFDEKENFELKAYSIEVTSDGEEIYTPFLLNHVPKSIINDILVKDSTPNLAPFDQESHYDSKFLEYYLDIQYDTDIPEETICRAVGQLEIKNIFLDEYIDCEDVLDRLSDAVTENVSIYGTRVTPDDLEDCD